ncbi:type II toxin-antitoxin system RelE/ParE family toxin [Providencia sp. Je.9.19]|uniref:type II toxin-antitoxin system RelE/ParE family toxin n=1 Tax=Providencia sp. Je.9.19 TaxID=3142844 RepID=UPI003DA8D326
MKEIKQTDAFRLWEFKLKDKRARTIIATRLFRLANGLAGDAMPVGEGISELRIHHGPGYRVYFQQRGNTIILLLCGGKKGSQSRDITLAKTLAKKWILEENDDE